MLKIAAALLIALSFIFTSSDTARQTADDSQQKWTYKHLKDAITDKESDELAIQGNYLIGMPSPHDAGAPALGVSCSDGKLNGLTILTGVVIHTRPEVVFGAKVGTGAITTIRIRVDDGKPKTDRVAEVLEDSKTLRFKKLFPYMGGSGIFFAKKYVVAVESFDSREVEIGFNIPIDSSEVQKYCGLKPN